MPTPDYSFQDDAVESVVRDFSNKPDGRFLLVLPTGGGKTRTAMRVIWELAGKGVISPKKPALWIVHKTSLRKQTEVYRDLKAKGIPEIGKPLTDLIVIRMKAAGKAELRTREWGLIVIDEAHHSPADGYAEFMEGGRPVLGLTATPTRNDTRDLNFHKISFNITFRELIRRGVIVAPEFHRIKTKERFLSNFPSGLEEEEFNSSSRNRFIAEEILKRAKLFKKPVVFVGTVKHVEALYVAIKRQNEIAGKPFDHVGFIHGQASNDQDIDNEEYLEWHKKKKSSILVNCQILNEGYDDPSVDGVVMAAPTSSLPYYLQCIGRAVRYPTEGARDKAHVLEFVDKLPDASYSIDNRWLFLEVSQFLKPQVLSRHCATREEFEREIRSLREQFRLPARFLEEVEKKEDYDDVSILLFCGARDHARYEWNSLVFTKENRQERIRIFNYLSDNVDANKGKGIKYLLTGKLGVPADDPLFGRNDFPVNLWEAIKLARTEVAAGVKVERLQYFTFHKTSQLPPGLIEFVSTCWNREELLNSLEDALQVGKEHLLRFPLILGGFEGYFLTPAELKFCVELCAELAKIASQCPPQSREARLLEALLSLPAIPIPPRYLVSFPAIVSEGIDKNLFHLK